jgi:hypothetical protein
LETEEREGCSPSALFACLKNGTCGSAGTHHRRIGCSSFATEQNAMIDFYTPLLALAPYLALAALLAFIPADTVPNDES